MEEEEGEEEEMATAIISSSSKATSSVSSNWKLYQNPLYNHHRHHHRGNYNTRFPHRPLRPPRKQAAASLFWDLAQLRQAPAEQWPGKEDGAEALRAELERERRARVKLEHINAKLAEEVGEERSRRAAIERVCERLAKEIEEEGRKMSLTTMMEEKLQMKLAETAKSKDDAVEQKMWELRDLPAAIGKPVKRPALAEKHYSSCTGGHRTGIQRRFPTPLPSPENPHIKRGIKGSVEFPRVVRAIGSKAKKIDSQKEEHIRMMVLMKQRRGVLLQ
ncbi:hypothetical protein SAY87_014568 [Trapa incisa]|uniref:Branchless trichome n=1 Tax=Trapa incisa TaxID=236973 RepID=A0AAN7JKJ9_9MYRT|nr:hypothetical protein SAY87_014568 [Trapa incisa]